jgi:electron transfer flavoprotein beta subunit
MNFKVCIKQVPDITAPIKIRDGELIMETDRMVLDAYSASAVEESLVLTEEHGGDVEVISIGPDKAKETIRKALAMGAKNATHIVTDDDAEYDSATFAKILAAHFKNNAEYDVIALGKQSQDTDAGLTGSMLAELLDLPYATNAVALKMDPENKKLIVTRQADTAQEVIELSVPCIVTCSNDMNNPRIPSLKGIMQSKRKPVETVQLTDIGLDGGQLGSEAHTSIVGYEDMPEREPGKKFEGEPEELAKQLVDLLDNEAKVL